jgi:hypothetical protein
LSERACADGHLASCYHQAIVMFMTSNRADKPVAPPEKKVIPYFSMTH